jgi:hypothetical protein
VERGTSETTEAAVEVLVVAGGFGRAGHTIHI